MSKFVDPIGCNILGQTMSSPVGFGSFPHQGMAHKDGEIASAMAAASLNQMYCLSASSTKSIEEVAEAVGTQGKLMFETDLRLPNEVRYDLIKRISKFQCFKAIVINSQYQTLRITENEWKNDFEVPRYLKAGTLIKYKNKMGSSDVVRSGYGLLANDEKSVGITTEMISLTKRLLINEGRSDIKIVVKGIMSKEDAAIALDAGANAIWVSNGGHIKQEGQPSAVNALKAIVSNIRPKYPQAQIFIDSGVTRGTDILKCIAYGADAVFISRPVMWGLNFGGEEGCQEMMTMLNEELKLCMCLTHCFDLKMIKEEQVIH